MTRARRRVHSTAVSLFVIAGLPLALSPPAKAQAPVPRPLPQAVDQSAPARGRQPAARPQASPAGQGWRFDVGGRLQMDHDTFRGQYGTTGKTASTGYIRRARIDATARKGDWRHDLELEPLEDGPGWLGKLFVTYSGWDRAAIRAGRFKPDFGLEQATSSRWITAIERSAIWDLAPDANDYTAAGGVQLATHGDRYHGSVAWFRKREHQAQTVRLAYVPWRSAQGLAHLGLSFSNEDIDEGNGRIRSRLGVHGVTESARGERLTLASSLRDGFDSDRAFLIEAAVRQGPWSLQAEYLRRRLGGIGDGGSREARGHYVQLAWTVTGEARPYEMDGAGFGAIRPERRDIGAWEVFARRDRLRVTGDDDGVGEGSGRASARVWSTGVNWYPNRRFKLSAALLWSRSHGVATEAGTNAGRALSLRAQLVF